MNGINDLWLRSIIELILKHSDNLCFFEPASIKNIQEKLKY